MTVLDGDAAAMDGFSCPADYVAAFNGPVEARLAESLLAAAVAETRRTLPRIGRNKACPCGSGRRFKRCCLHAN